MKRSAPGDGDDLPFDLPLDSGRSTAEGTQPQLPLEPLPARARPPAPGAPTTVDAGDGDGEAALLYGRRWAGGVLDLAVQIAVLASAIAGSWWLGVSPDRLLLWPLALFAASFSFLYHVLPLTFWGQTPGMASVGLAARAVEGGPLTINQAVQRWLGAVLNVLSLGLVFFFRRNRSLPDILSRSTVQEAS